MLRFVLFCTLLCLVSANPLENDFYGRIVGGSSVSIDNAPYQVSLQTNKGSHFCGGSLINEDTVVTAAHCMQQYAASEFKVRLGSSSYKTGGDLVSVRTFKSHEGYNADIMINDVAVIKLATPVGQSSNIRYVKLARKTPSTGTPALVTGWGTTCYLWCGVSTDLLGVEVDVVQQADCASDQFKYGSGIQETMVCGYNPKKDACQGDSGGPLVANNELVGVVSWGYGCARDGYPGVYADVSSLRTWIEDTANTL